MSEKKQIKFYVSEEEQLRLKKLASLRYMSVPAYAKSVALGVQIHQVEEIYVENKKLDVSDRELLEELVEREEKKGYIRVDMEFNERLIQFAKKKLSE
ncbi:plasmid mobilization protein [Enterococcus sp. AZ102]|uniref:plasmid mobilization protein n=1 Tax=Enterococcus sp. AZ102 TaxID=2774865 RepID=UPI003F29E319